MQTECNYQDNRTHSALDGVGVDLDAAVVKEAGGPFPFRWPRQSA
jgi:hypothetical protein